MGWFPEFQREFCLNFFNSMRLRNAALSVPDDLWNKTTSDLEAIVRPTKIEFELKLRYWQLVHAFFRALQKKHTIKALHMGICSYTNLYAHVLAHPVKVAWLLKPHTDYANQIRVLQYGTVELLQEISSLEMRGPDGKISFKNAHLLLKAHRLIWGIQDRTKR